MQKGKSAKVLQTLRQIYNIAKVLQTSNLQYSNVKCNCDGGIEEAAEQGYDRKYNSL